MEGFKLEEQKDYEDDNIKIFHFITPPGGKEVFVDHSPYERIDRATLERYAKFFEKHGRFPSRNDIQSCGPLYRRDLVKLTEEE